MAVAAKCFIRPDGSTMPVDGERIAATLAMSGSNLIMSSHDRISRSRDQFRFHPFFGYICGDRFAALIN